ncbi:hypothetical protein X750_28435 [Mesorhizobium sp. LNJC394B00]|nr:hypothetical protein X750_28435 [Mesorhizobium sp. LNJC394B00]
MKEVQIEVFRKVEIQSEGNWEAATLRDPYSFFG